MQSRYIEQSMSTATRAINQLQKLGLTVEHLELGGGGKPRIKVGYSPRCELLGQPVSFSRGNNGLNYETWLVQYEGCQVSWVRK